MALTGRLVGPDDFTFRGFRLDEKVAVLSIDVESDYNSRQYEALGHLGELLAEIRAIDVPLTAFVEGQFFANRKNVPEQLVAADVDVQLHCFDHLKSGDDPADLRKGIAAYSAYMGRRPKGYRANTYRLTVELAQALMDEGFEWDSSLLPAVAQGGKRVAGVEGGDYYLLGRNLVEFPLSTWRNCPIPLIHSYRQLLKPPIESVFRTLFGYPNFVVYDMHMADLVWSGSLRSSPLPRHVKLLYRYMWGFNRRNSFASLRRFVGNLKASGYTFRTMSQLFAEVRTRALAGS